MLDFFIQNNFLRKAGILGAKIIFDRKNPPK